MPTHDPSSLSTTSAHPTRSGGRDLAVIIGYFVLTLVLSAACAPWFYYAAKSVVAAWETRGWHEWPGLSFIHAKVVKADFNRVFNRTVLIVAVACLFPALRLLAIPWRELRLPKLKGRWWHVLVGFVLGAGLLLLMGGGYLSAGFFVWKKNIAWGSLVRESVQRAVGVGLIEELFFRGLLLGLLLKTLSPWRALVAVSLIFSVVHFLQAPPDLEIRSGVNAGTGFWLIGLILENFTQAHQLLAEFTTLLIVGFMLGWARLRTGTLHLAIGLHAGWVFGVGLFSGMTRVAKAVRLGELIPWVGPTLKSGLVPLAVLALTWALLWQWVRFSTKRFS